MDAGTIVAVLLGIMNMGLLVLMALRKEGKDEAQRRQDECQRREALLLQKIEACDDERRDLNQTVAIMKAKQEMWDKLLPQFKLVQPAPDGRRSYERTGGTGGGAEG